MDYNEGYEDNTILSIKQIARALKEHGMTFKIADTYIECEGEILKEMSITELKSWLGY